MSLKTREREMNEFVVEIQDNMVKKNSHSGPGYLGCGQSNSIRAFNPEPVTERKTTRSRYMTWYIIKPLPGLPQSVSEESRCQVFGLLLPFQLNYECKTMTVCLCSTIQLPNKYNWILASVSLSPNFLWRATKNEISCTRAPLET